MLNNVRALCPGGRKAVAKVLACSALVGGALLIGTDQVVARTISLQHVTGGGAPGACTAHAGEIRGKTDIRIVCRGTNGVRIGEVDSYESATNRSSGAVVVRVSSYGRIRVFFAFADTAGQPFVQDVTRDLARAAGRNADAGLENVSIDFERFDSAMVIGVADRGKLDSPQGALDLTRYLTLSRQILPGVPASPTNSDPSRTQVVQ